MSKKEVKTNAMRILDCLKISYTYQTYECDEFTDGIQTAEQLGLNHELVFKTLVTTGKSGAHYVFVIPIEEEIEGRKNSGREVFGDASAERTDTGDRICAGRLYLDWYEEKISYSGSGNGSAV